MKNSEVILLDMNTLKEINGGSQESYELGLKVGNVIHKWLIAIGIVSIFI